MLKILVSVSSSTFRTYKYLCCSDIMVYVSMCFSNNMLLHFYLFINNILKLLEFLSSLKEIYSISYRSRTADVLLSKRRNTLQLAVQMNKKRRLLPSKWSTSVCHILSEEHFKQVKRDKQRLLNGYFLSTPGRTYPSTDALGWRITNLFFYEACITPRGHS